jgi:hypothetical protein
MKRWMRDKYSFEFFYFTAELELVLDMQKIAPASQ